MSTWAARSSGTLLSLALWASGAVAFSQETAGWLELHPWDEPCAGNCATAIYAGWYVDDSLGDVLFASPSLPVSWHYRGDHIVATAISRRAATLWGHVDVEPEFGVAQRFGDQSETEVWGAAFFRYRGFPWDDRLVTTVAVSTGMNYATGISAREAERARDGEGARWMHFFSPEVTFALPRAPQYELMFRMHHRSGVFGLVSDAWGGAQYGTIGLRVRF
jgi:hypothetical protein